MERVFLSTLSLRRATAYPDMIICTNVISIHALLAESDYRERTSENRYRHFYPRSPCGERPPQPPQRREFYKISIHALLAESDLILPPVDTSSVSISIHALLAESDYKERPGQTARPKFLSTLSLRRATVLVWFSCGGACDFYPRSPCGERPGKGPAVKGYRNFYPRSPCGERLNTRGSKKVKLNNFYPRSPCGERLYAVLFLRGSSIFLSTLSLRRATWAATVKCTFAQFLSTLSLRRATGGYVNGKNRQINFYPRSPCGERRKTSGSIIPTIKFLSTLSLRRATRESGAAAPAPGISIHALLAESDRAYHRYETLCN